MQSVIKTSLIASLIAVIPVTAYYLFLPNHQFSYFCGLIPWDYQHLHGILLMPFAHADPQHLWGNTIQLFLGVFLVFLHFRNVSKYILLIQWLGTGAVLFFIGKVGTLHIGSSGVVYGLFGFLIFAGFFAGNRRLRLLSFMILMYYGGMLWGVFPWQEKVSWEGHLAGLLVGTVTAVLFSRQYRLFTRDSKPVWFYDTSKREDPYRQFDKQN